MGKISIKIRNSYGINKLKGDDLSLEESLALIELAKTIALQGEAVLSADPFTYDELTAEIANDNLHKSVETDSNESEADTNVAPITVDDTSDSVVRKGMPILANAMNNAFATKFGTSPTTEEEDNSLLSADELMTTEEQLEVLNKDFFETGVKYKLYGGEILPFYRVRWECPKCGDKGNHYGPENIKQMYCYNCNAALTVRSAAGRFPNRDEWGNFFVADELNMKFIRA